VRAAPYAVLLRRALTVSGVVSLGGAPVPGASFRADGRFLADGGVEAAPPAGEGILEHGAWEAETDEQGRFEVLGLPPGTVRLTVSHHPQHRRGGPLVVEVGSSGHVVPMRSDPVIRVRVHSPDGEPVGSVEV
jgi:hypothetical protein